MTDRRSGFYDRQAETMPAAERRAMQDGILRGVAQYCYEGSTTYRQKMDAAGLTPDTIASLDDLPAIPITRKSETQDMRFEGIMVVPYNQARRIFVSPGPQFYAYGPIPQEANPLLRVYHAIGFRKGDVVINTFTYHLTPAGINFDESLGAFGCAVVPAGPGNTDLQVEILSKLDVTGYVGTPSFLKIIASKARELGVNPRGDFSIQIALTTAESLPQPLRAELEDTYGCMVRQLYGSADGLLPCYECWAADGMHVTDLMVLEIVDPESWEPVPHGTPGAVVATVANPYRPLLRFANGDRAVMRDDPCVCGRTSPRIWFMGRIDEAAKVRGMFVYPEQIAEALGRFPEIAAWRAFVDRDAEGLDDFIVEFESPADESLAEKLTDALRAVVRVRARVAPVSAGTIPGEERGHLRDRRS
ncbi:MAG: phenylacetate--CoA ligase family protein [Actinomycetota bacterium]